MQLVELSVRAYTGCKIILVTYAKPPYSFNMVFSIFQYERSSSQAWYNSSRTFCDPEVC